MKKFIERFKQDPITGIIFLFLLIVLVMSAVNFICYCVYWDTPIEEVPGFVRFALGWRQD